MTSDLKKIWAILTPVEKSKALWMLLLVILMAVAEVVSVLSITPFLSVLGRPEIVQEQAALKALYEYLNFESVHEFILALGLASMLLVIASSLFKTVTQHLLNRFVHLQRHSLSTRLLSCYLHQPYEFFLTRNPSILAKNVLSEIDQLMFEGLQPLSQVVAQGSVVLAMALLIFFYNPLIAISSVTVLAFFYGGIYALVRTRLEKIGNERQEANGQRYQACNEVLGGIKDMKVTHSIEAYQGKFNQASRLFSRHFATNDTLNQTPLYLVEAVGYSGLIIIALVLLMRSNDVAQVLPALGLYGFAAYRMLPAAQIIYRGFARLKFTSSALNALHNDLKLPKDNELTSTKRLPLCREIRLHGIRYAYPSAPDKPVFNDYNLVIPVNASIGIVGKSGAGKSTLVDILLGLLQPQAGVLSVDDIPITLDNVASWQRSIGYVPQHIYLADTSVKENIAFGVPLNEIDMEAVQRAAYAAQIHDFVMTDLPQGYETQIGDRGIRLSGGQRQRLGIARALYNDPAVLFMDEATSSLDVDTEKALNEAVNNLLGKKTIVIIAHKESSLKSCNEIIRISSDGQ